ncbi:MAG: amidohydrolase family protein, partial [Gemmatimonadales bacterium]
MDDARQVIENGTVLVTGSRIACVGSCDASRADRVVDLSGKTVMPGIMDMHMHFGRPSGGFIPPQSWEIARYLAYGTTAGREPADWPEHNVPLKELIDAGRVVGPRTFVVGGIMNSWSFGGYDLVQLLRGDVAINRSTFHDIPDLATARDEIDRIIRWVGEGVALKNYYQGARDRRQWLVHAARERGITVTAEDDDLYYNLGYVMDGNAGFEHGIRNLPVLKDAATFLGQAGVVYSATMSAGTGQQRGKEYWLQVLDVWKDPKARLWQPWQAFIPAQRRRVKRPLTDYRYPLYAQGIADVIAEGGYGAIGSHGEIAGPASHYEVWMHAAAMSPMQALEVATRHAAYFLGAEQDLGSIEVGKLADLIVLNQNPLDDIRNTLDLAYVMKGGRLYEDDTLNEIWPESRPYGPRPWVNEGMLRMDERSIDYHDKKRGSR